MGLFVYSNLSLPTVAADTIKQTPPEEPTYRSLSVSMTGYNAVPEQTDGDPFTTASGAYSNPEVIAARSVDLAEDLPFGTVIEVVPSSAAVSNNCGLSAVEDHLGLRVIADSMHPRKRNQIDLLFVDEKVIKARGTWVNPAVALGVCSDVEVRIVGKIDVKDIPKTQAELKLAMGYLPKAEPQTLAVKKF